MQLQEHHWKTGVHPHMCGWRDCETANWMPKISIHFVKPFCGIWKMMWPVRSSANGKRQVSLWESSSLPGETVFSCACWQRVLIWFKPIGLCSNWTSLKYAGWRCVTEDQLLTDTMPADREKFVRYVAGMQKDESEHCIYRWSDASNIWEKTEFVDFNRQTGF